MSPFRHSPQTAVAPVYHICLDADQRSLCLSVCGRMAPPSGRPPRGRAAQNMFSADHCFQRSRASVGRAAGTGQGTAGRQRDLMRPMIAAPIPTRSRRARDAAARVPPDQASSLTASGQSEDLRVQPEAERQNEDTVSKGCPWRGLGWHQDSGDRPGAGSGRDWELTSVQGQSGAELTLF